MSREVVDTRLIQFVDQLRGYWTSREAGGPDRVPGDGAPAPNPVIGSPDVGWIWQISGAGSVIDISPLLRLTGAGIKPRVTEIAAKLTISNATTPLGGMRIAERIIDEVPPFSSEDDGEKTIRVHYLGRVGGAMDGYEDGRSETIEVAHPRELQHLVDRMKGLLQQNTMLIDRTRKYVSKIAHDINHPLAIIKNGLRGDVDTPVLERQVERMAGLVDRYSSLARAIGLEGQVQRQTDIADALNDIAEGFTILYRRTPLDISCSCDPALTFFVARHDLEAMVSNLVSNAHKFAEEKVVLSAELRGGNLVVQVDDDGPGITPEQREAALDWGGRLGEAPPRTGFGLSIVRDIVALYDGEMRLGEAVLSGLSFEIELPGKGR